MSKLKKAKFYYKKNGFWYLLKRGIKYLWFLIKKRKLIVTVVKDKLKVVCGEKGIKVFWQNIEITNHHGFNTGLLVLTQWHESSKALWKVRKINETLIEAKVRFADIPVSQIWEIKVLSQNNLLWNIRMLVEEDIEIDEAKLGVLLSSRYKRWINSNEEGSFPKIRNWEKITLTNPYSKLIGVRNYRIDDNFLPGLLLDFSNTNVDTYPYILNSDSEINSRFIQIRVMKDKKIASGWYDFFKVKIILQDKEDGIESLVENFRRKIVKHI